MSKYATRKQVVLDQFKGESTTNAMTHKDAEVTVTDTMKHGSLLKADFTEAAKAEADEVVFIINEPTITDTPSGEPKFLSVVDRMCKVNTDALTFSDGAYTTEALPKLVEKQITFDKPVALSEDDILA
tara:strand:+ start:1452 stop:1835 length:384 start_codon:yes stop_codon:yes gene_type:complete